MILDSGERFQFDTGAVRDIQKGKGRCDLLPLTVVGKTYDPDVTGDGILFHLADFLATGSTWHLYAALRSFADVAYDGSLDTMFLEVSKHFEEGAEKYGPNNWQKGLPVRCYVNSAIRHYMKWHRGDDDERHDRGVVWNICCCAWEVDEHNGKID